MPPLLSLQSSQQHWFDYLGAYMVQNMGNADRAIRALVAVAIVALYLTGRISGTLAVVLGLIAVAFLVTSLVGWCPVYMPMGLSTRGKGTPPAPAA